MLVPEDLGRDLPSEELFHDEWVIVMDRHHPSAPHGPSIDDLQALPWVLFRHSRTPADSAAQLLRLRGIEPWVQVSTETYLTVPPLVVGSDRLALVPTRLFDAAVDSRGLVSRPCPVRLAPLVQRMWWHRVHNYNPQHRFLRHVVMTTAQEVGGGHEGPVVAGAHIRGEPSRIARYHCTIASVELSTLSATPPPPTARCSCRA
ncbi:hypothetical protein CJ179_12310 [Rhodococcus sp. ACS1]|nr:hypothetical protein CJ179_12310 [Rhodococcus sp. ACS1]